MEKNGNLTLNSNENKAITPIGLKRINVIAWLFDSEMKHVTYELRVTLSVAVWTRQYWSSNRRETNHCKRFISKYFAQQLDRQFKACSHQQNMDNLWNIICTQYNRHTQSSLTFLFGISTHGKPHNWHYTQNARNFHICLFV